MPDRLERVRDLAERAGEIALARFGRIPWRTKSDGSPVSEADEAIESFLTTRLQADFPGIPVLGEEAFSSRTGPIPQSAWVLDPIDGTSAFCMRLPTWCISIGLVEQGRAVLGVVFCPMLEEWYLADLEASDEPYAEGRWWGRRPLRLDPDNPPTGPSDSLLGPSNLHRAYQLTYRGKVRSLGSTVMHFMAVARGDVAGCVGRVRIWDIAAAAAILQAAGASVSMLSGAPLDLPQMMDGQITQPVLAAHPARVDEIRAGVTFNAVLR